VGETVAAVTDTHALLFHAAGGGRLGKKAGAHYAACERREALVYVPAAVIWETALLARAGRVNLRRSVRGFYEDLFSNPAYVPHDLSARQVLDAEELRVNRDPFDALICAAAKDLDLPLVTRDGDIGWSGWVRVLWLGRQRRQPCLARHRPGGARPAPTGAACS
jgi:PIN domain nuclease of toxin-antitoxin system